VISGVRALLGAALAIGLVACAPNQADYPVAVGVFDGEMLEADETAGTITVETARYDTLDTITLAFGARGEHVVVLEGPSNVEGLESRTFVLEADDDDGTAWKVTGWFEVRETDAPEHEATRCVGEIAHASSPDGTLQSASYSFEARHVPPDDDDDEYDEPQQ